MNGVLLNCRDNWKRIQELASMDCTSGIFTLTKRLESLFCGGRITIEMAVLSLGGPSVDHWPSFTEGRSDRFREAVCCDGEGRSGFGENERRK
eukprot:m.10958 g.10958  ORF g.10958 m.10958 type:complete len:93 (+) comp22831_c0_seq2:116-394(+)